MHVSQLMEDPEADFDAITLGAHQADEFTWKQLLDSVSCTECARCTTSVRLMRPVGRCRP